MSHDETIVGAATRQLQTPHDCGGSAAVLVVDDDPAMLDAVGRAIGAGHPGWTVVGRPDAASALVLLEKQAFDAVVVDLVMPHIGGLKLLTRIRARVPEMPVIMLTASDRVDNAVECMRRGAYDFQVKPPDPDRLNRALQNAVARSRLTQTRSLHVASEPTFEEMVGTSPPMRAVYRQIQRVRDSNVSVLVHGETGTGKELVARAIHDTGARATGPLVTLNCGAIPEQLQESLLFGHEKGAFTGAMTTKIGSFEQAHGGTLFLDELGELSSTAQVSLLRVLQEGRLRRLGGNRDIEVDVRVVSATHRDLRMMVEQGAFREDLYYRLVVYPIHLPALRERTEDIDALVRRFLDEHAAEVPTRISRVDPAVLQALMAHRWPGNVRELDNVVRRAALQADGDTLRIEHLPAELAAAPAVCPAAHRRPTPHDPPAVRSLSMADSERHAIERALRITGGNVTRAAVELGVARATVYRKMARLGIDPDQVR